MILRIKGVNIIILLFSYLFITTLDNKIIILSLYAIIVKAASPDIIT